MCRIVVFILLLAHSPSGGEASTVRSLWWKNEGLKINPTLGPEWKETANITVSWVEVNCKLYPYPSCPKESCSVTLEGQRASYMIRPYMKMEDQYSFGKPANCSKLYEKLRYLAPSKTNPDHDAKYLQVQKSLPYADCPYLAIPDIGGGSTKYDECVEMPFMFGSRGMTKDDDWLQVNYTTAFKNGTSEEEFYLIRRQTSLGNDYAFFPDSPHRFSKYVETNTVKKPCYHEILYQNLLPVAVTMSIKWYKGEKTIVMKPKDYKPWTTRRSWYTVIVPDTCVNTNRCGVNATITQIDAPVPYTFQPGELESFRYFEPKKYSCFTRRELEDSLLLVE